MAAVPIAVIAAVVLGIALVAERIRPLPLTVPMLALLAGVVVGPLGTDVLTLRPGDEGSLLLAEVTLATLLFTDAARIDLASLREGVALPARLLGIGLPLAIVGGVVLVMGVFGGGVGDALVVAALLAPTDAALGQAIVGDERLPVAVRQGLNVEAGLNDGLVLPVLTFGLVLASGDTGDGVAALLLPVPAGIALGATIGAAGTWLLGRVRERGGLDLAWEQLGVLAILALTFGAAEHLGANAFLAAFAAGLALRAVAGEDAGRMTAYSEDTAQVLSMVAFLLFGALFLPDAFNQTSLAVVVVAVLSLTVVRPVAVWVSLVGARLRPPTRLLLGWFGPRGLATVLLGTLVLLGEQAPPATVGIVGWTVLLSVLAHGATAAPLASRYAAWFDDGEMDDSPEAAVTSRPVLRWQRGG